MGNNSSSRSQEHVSWTRCEPISRNTIFRLNALCSWPFFLGFGVVGFAMAKISVPTGNVLSSSTQLAQILCNDLYKQRKLRAEQNLKDSTITPHEDKKYAATA